MPEPTDPDADARNALRLIGPAPQNWVPDRPGIDHNVMIVGGGQSGCAFAFALRRAGIGKIAVIDMAADEEQAGIWLNCARMSVLRTPKTLPGPENGIAALNFQSWYEARHGAAAYAAFDRAPRRAWAEYLAWYRQFLGITVRYRTRLLRIEPADGHFRLHLDINGAVRVETARKVIIATGFEGSGGVYVPPALSAGLPARLYAHTQDPIDFLQRCCACKAGGGWRRCGFGLRRSRRGARSRGGVGRSIRAPGGIGLGAGGAGARLSRRLGDDHLGTARRGALAPGNPLSPRRLDAAGRRPRAGPEKLEFPPATRRTPPAAREEDGHVVARAADGEFRCDFAIAGTGYFVDPGARPELVDFASDILLWRDRFTPPPDEQDEFLGAHPYLGIAHEYLEKTPGAAPYLKDIHVQNPAGFVSFGVPVGDVPSMKRGLPAVTQRISRDLFFADFPAHEKRLTSDIAPEFSEALYVAAVWGSPTNF